jgi:hypothetical protein
MFRLLLLQRSFPLLRNPGGPTQLRTLALGVGVAGTAVGTPVAAGNGVRTALGSTVGAVMEGGCAVGAPVNRKTVPRTMLNATSPFSPIEAYQRQFFFVDLGFALLGMPCSFKFYD